MSLHRRMSISDRRDERLADAEHLREFRSGKTTHPDSGDVVVREFHVRTETSVVRGRDNLKVLRVDAKGDEAQMMKMHPVRNGAVNGFVGRSMSLLVLAEKIYASVSAGILRFPSRRLVTDPDVAWSFVPHVLRFPLKEWFAAKRASDVFGRKLGWFSTAATASRDVHASSLSRHNSLCLTT